MEALLFDFVEARPKAARIAGHASYRLAAVRATGRPYTSIEPRWM